MLLIRVRSVALLVLLVFAVTVVGAQTVTPAVSADAPPAHQEGDKLLGGYGPYRANNDLLHYSLHVRVDPYTQYLSGDHAIRFRMIEDGDRKTFSTLPGSAG